MQYSSPEQTLQAYLDGSRDLDRDRIAPCFHPKAIMSGRLLGNPVIGTPQLYLDDIGRMAAQGVSNEAYAAHIESITVEGSVASATITQAQFNLWTTGLFLFVRELVAGRVKGFEQFKRVGIEFDHQPVANEIAVSDELLKAYKTFMTDFIAKTPDAGLNKELLDANADFARNKIREELLMAAYGQDMVRRIQLLDDPQVQRGLTELPNAAQLAEKARRLTKSASK